MRLIIPIIILFTILFLSLSIWIYQGEKEEIQRNRLRIFTVIGTALILSFIPSIVVAIALFGLFGSTNIINMLFSLQIDKNHLIFLALTLIVYLFTLDSLFELIAEAIMGKNSISIIILFLVRISAFYILGIVFNLKQSSAFTIAIGVAVITLLLDIHKLIKNKRDINK